MPTKPRASAVIRIARIRIARIRIARKARSTSISECHCWHEIEYHVRDVFLQGWL